MQIHTTTVAKIRDQLSVLGIKGIQETSGGEEDTPVITIFPV